MSDLSFEIHFDTDLYTSNSISILQNILIEISPVFCEQLRVLEFERDSKYIPIDCSAPDALKKAVKTKGLKRGPTYAKLAAKHSPKSTRRFGDALVYGNARATFLNVSFDEYVPGRLSGDIWLFSNSISGNTKSKRIGGIPQIEWVRQIMLKMCEDPAVLWGAAFHKDEFHEKNIDKSDGMRAIGRNIKIHLPGLYWINIFGPKYRGFIGDEHFENLAVFSSIITGSSRFIELYEQPEDWSTKFAQDNCREVTKEIGQKYFFSREKPNAKTIAPDFTLPSYSQSD